MHPILFQLGPITIYSYGLAMALAFLTAAYLARKEAKQENIDPDKILNLSLGAVIFGILGARALYVLQNLGFYLRYPQEIIMLHKGGLSFYGGFILAIIFAAIYLRRKRLAALKTLNLIAPYLALAQAIGRIGCFFNGCCGGTRHPVQLYESLGLVLIFVILRLRPKNSLIAYCILYGFLRFFMEYLRADRVPLWANLTLHQLISLALIITGSIFWWRNEEPLPKGGQKR